MVALQQKLQKLKESRSSDKTGTGLSSSKNQPEAGEVPLVELSISCDNLLCDGHGRPPSPQTALEYLDTRDLVWQRIGQTESVEDSSNPIFLVTMPLWSCMGIQHDTKYFLDLFLQLLISPIDTSFPI